MPICVAKAFSMAEALALQSYLGSHGIPYTTRHWNTQNLIGAGSLSGVNPAIGPIEIWVPHEFAQAAKAALDARFEIETLAKLEACPACSAALKPYHLSCPGCGLSLT